MNAEAVIEARSCRRSMGCHSFGLGPTDAIDTDTESDRKTYIISTSTTDINGAGRA